MQTYSIETPMDPRFTALWNGLSQLTDEELERILKYPNEMCLDSYNYDESRATYCPLAVAFGIPDLKFSEKMTNELCQSLIAEFGGEGFVFNQLKGTPGTFFRDNRAGDLQFIINAILIHRSIDG